MFLWTRPAGLKVFRNTPEKAELTRVLAANQGLYNGFLAAGLAWAVLSSQRDVALFFLGCVVVAGLYGTATVRPEEHTSELQSLMRISSAVFRLKKKTQSDGQHSHPYVNSSHKNRDSLTSSPHKKSATLTFI